MNVTSGPKPALKPPSGVAAKLEIPEGTFVLTYDKLDPEAIIGSVRDKMAGAIAVFIGTARDSFQGQGVMRLEYQAFSKMAVKMMGDIFQSAHANATRSEHAVASGPPASPLLHCMVYHRLGVVPVGESMVVVAVSSPHRKEAFMACEYLLEQVKLKVPIWKKEAYASGETQ